MDTLKKLINCNAILGRESWRAPQTQHEHSWKQLGYAEHSLTCHRDKDRKIKKKRTKE